MGRFRVWVRSGSGLGKTHFSQPRYIYIYILSIFQMLYYHSISIFNDIFLYVYLYISSNLIWRRHFALFLWRLKLRRSFIPSWQANCRRSFIPPWQHRIAKPTLRASQSHLWSCCHFFFLCTSKAATTVSQTNYSTSFLTQHGTHCKATAWPWFSPQGSSSSLLFFLCVS